MVTIRPFQPSAADYAAIVAIHNAYWPDDPQTIAEVQQQDAARDPAHFFARLVGELNGTIVLVGQCGATVWLAEPDQYSWHINILPHVAEQGLEEQMHDALMALLAERRPRRFYVGIRDDKLAQVAFLEHEGYRLIQTEPTSSLDVTRFDAGLFAECRATIARLGIQIVDVQRLQQVDPTWMHKLWELQWQIRQDVPQSGPITRQPFAEFAQWVTDPERYDPTTHFIALQQNDVEDATVGPYIGMTRFSRHAADPTIAETHLAGVIRTHRRKGIATALKVHAIAVAQNHGVQRMNTMNNETNPMLELNLRLGFTPGPAWRYYVKVL